MEFQKLIESRRSIRKYDGSKKVTKEQIETLISAATEAPSWKNSETARYYCVLILIMKSAMAGVFTILVCTMRYFFSKRLSLA